MATGGGEVGGQIPDTAAGSEDLSELKCQPCHEDGRIREAVGICVDCQDYLCRKCFNSHTIPRPFKKHQLLDKQQMIQNNIKIQTKDICTQKCSRHGEKVIEYYCNVHGQLGCNVCLNLDHRTCKPVQYIPDAADDLDNNAEFKEAENCLSSVLKLCQKVYDIGTENVESIETSCAEALDDVETYRSEVNDALDKIQSDIVQKALTMKARALDKITTIADKYQKTQRELQVFQTNAEHLQRRHQNCDMYTNMMKLKVRLDTLEDEITEVEKEIRHLGRNMRFTRNLDFLETLRKPEIFGRLTEEQGMVLKAEHSVDIGAKCRVVTGCTLLPDNRLVIVDNYTADINVVDVQKNKVISQMRPSSSPWDVCTINPNQVAVTLENEQKVSFVNVNGNMNVDRSINVIGSCRGLDFKNNKLAVSYHTPDKVQVMTLHGQVLHNITTDQQGQTLFSNPWYVSFDKSDTSLYVSNCTGNNVVRVKLDGTRMASYTDNELQGPLGIMIGSDGNVYVCGFHSHNIHQISPYCRKLEQTDGIIQPRSISYSDTENKYYVGYGGSNIQVYRAVRETN